MLRAKQPCVIANFKTTRTDDQRAATRIHATLHLRQHVLPATRSAYDTLRATLTSGAELLLNILGKIALRTPHRHVRFTGNAPSSEAEVLPSYRAFCETMITSACSRATTTPHRICVHSPTALTTVLIVTASTETIFPPGRHGLCPNTPRA